MRNLTLTVLFVLSVCVVKAQRGNTLLQNDFWSAKPTLERVKAEIANGNDPAQQDQRLMDPTSLAINSGSSLDVVKFLVAQKGNGVAKATHHSRTYLHWAAAKGDVELVKYLLSQGADPNKGDSYGTPSVAYAASVGQANPAIYDAFFKSPQHVKKKYANGANLILLAIAADKDFKLTNYFVAKGLSLKEADANGATAFDYAAKSANIELLKALIAKGVKPTSAALVFASQGGRNFSAPLETYKYLVDDLKLDVNFANHEGNTALHNVVRKPNQNDIITYMFSKGANVNAVNEDGNSVFMNAVNTKDIAVVEMLFPKVKNINTVNKKGESALSLAVANGTPKAVEYLLNNGADVKVVDKAGNNLGFYLVQSYKPNTGRGATPTDEFAEKLALLTAKGLAVSAPQKDGNTLYHIAIANLDLGLLKKITALNIDVNAKNKDGNTVLHRAALIAKDDAVLKYLLEIGADKKITTEFDETAFNLASDNKFLSSKGISVEFLK